MSEFKPKGEDQIRQETIEALGLDENEETHKPVIERAVAVRLKDEQMKASLHEQKTKAKKEADERAAKIAELEEASKSKGTTNEDKDKNKAEVLQLVAEQMFLEKGGSNTELRQIHKIMAATGKAFKDAQKDSLFIAFKEKNDREFNSRNSQLPPSRGGTATPSKELDNIASRNEGNLPPGFSTKKK